MNEELQLRREADVAPCEPRRIPADITVDDQSGRSRNVKGWFIGWRGQDAGEDLKTEGIFALGQHGFVPSAGTVGVRFADRYGNGKEFTGKISDFGGWTNALVTFDSPVDVQQVEKFVSREHWAKNWTEFVDVSRLLHDPVLAPGPTRGRVSVLVHQWAERHAPTAEIEEISSLASAVIGDPQEAVRWMSEPNVATDNRPPLDLIGEPRGYQRVKNLLLRAEFGTLA